MHIDALRRIGVAVTAIAASSPERSRSLAPQLSVPAACESAAELVGRDDVDVVHVCTPNALHAEQIGLALDAGKHVVSEKPLATSGDDARALVARAKASDLVHAVTYNYRFYPMLEEMRRWVSDGQLGRIHLIRGAYLLDEILTAGEGDSWMLDPERMGGSLVLADVGVHLWDLVEHVTALRVREVLCAHQIARGGVDGGGEDSAAVLLRLDGGALAMAAISNAAPGHANTIELELIGDCASCCWRQDDADLVRFGQLGAPVEVRRRGHASGSTSRAGTLGLPAGQPQGYLDGFRDLLAAVYHAVREGDGGPDYPTFEDGLHGIQVLDALMASADQGGWISVRS